MDKINYLEEIDDALEKYRKLKYSRQDEANLPKFKDWEEAEAYFKQKHGDDFVYQGMEVIDSKEYYFYDLVLDREAFERWEQVKLEAMKNRQFFIIDEDASLMLSCQRIEISEDGYIHMVH